VGAEQKPAAMRKTAKSEASRAGQENSPKGSQAGGEWFEAAFREHWTRVYAVLYRLVGDPAEAEDLALDAFLRLYHRPPPEARGNGLVGSGNSLAGWLYRVASNLGLNALRARQRRRHYEEQAGRLRLEQGPAHDPADEVERDLERQTVRRVLAGMKPRESRLLLLRYSGLSYAELAAAIEVSPSSVGALLARAEAEFERRYREIEAGAHPEP